MTRYEIDLQNKFYWLDLTGEWRTDERHSDKSNNIFCNRFVGSINLEMDRDNKILIADGDRHSYIEVEQEG